MIRALLKKTPIIGPVAVRVRRALRQRAAAKRRRPPAFDFARMDLDETPDEFARSTRQILNVLNYTKTSGAWYSAVRYPAGYHSIEINGQRIKGQRDPALRLGSVPFDFRGKSVLDVGCNQGGMLLQLADRLEWGVGIDYDSRMVNAANRMRAARKTNNLHFYVFDLEREPLDLIKDFIPSPKVDVVFLLAVCGWIENWRAVIDFSASLADKMLFETTGTEQQQISQEQHLQQIYRQVECLTASSEDDAIQKKRRLLFCSNAAA